jgi:hypothetical protein
MDNRHDRDDIEADEEIRERIERERIERNEDVPAREGDVLGLGGSAVPKAPGDPSADFDEESRARRHSRLMEDEIESGSDRTRTSGATGIDMGAGGTGTDIE